MESVNPIVRVKTNQGCMPGVFVRRNNKNIVVRVGRKQIKVKPENVTFFSKGIIYKGRVKNSFYNKIVDFKTRKLSRREDDLVAKKEPIVSQAFLDLILPKVDG